MNKNKQIILLIVLSSLLFFFKLGSFSLYDAAEATYGEFIKQIRLTGDWLTLHYNAQVIFDKPPLYFWLANLAAYVFGFNEFAIRFWAALSGVLLTVTTYFLGRSFYNQRTGFYAGLIAMTSFQFLIQSRIAELDILLSLLMTLGFYLFWQGYQTGKRHFFWLMYGCLALATLVKGLIGLAMPGFAIFLFLLFQRKLDFIKKMQVPAGILIVLIVGAPWYIAEWLLHGEKFTQFVLGFLFLSRFQGVVAGHPGPWYYYFLAQILGFAPWSHFLPYSLWRTWKNKFNPPELLSLCYIIPVFLVFSIARTKLPNYIFPLYPFLAIMVAKLWDDFLGEGRERLRKAMTIANVLLAVVVALIIIGFIMLGTTNYSGQYQELKPGLLLLAGALIIGAACSFINYFLRKYKASFASLVVTVLAIALVLTTSLLPQIEPYKGVKILSRIVNAKVRNKDRIAAFQTGNRPSIVFYSAKPVVFLKNEAELKKFLRRKQGYCYTNISEYKKYQGRVKALGKQGELVVIY